MAVGFEKSGPLNFNVMQAVTKSIVVPKSVLQRMKEKGKLLESVNDLTRENVASHLQKYRTKKANKAPEHPLSGNGDTVAWRGLNNTQELLRSGIAPYFPSGEDLILINLYYGSCASCHSAFTTCRTNYDVPFLFLYTVLHGFSVGI